MEVSPRTDKKLKRKRFLSDIGRPNKDLRGAIAALDGRPSSLDELAAASRQSSRAGDSDHVAFSVPAPKRRGNKVKRSRSEDSKLSRAVAAMRGHRRSRSRTGATFVSHKQEADAVQDTAHAIAWDADTGRGDHLKGVAGTVRYQEPCGSHAAGKEKRELVRAPSSSCVDAAAAAAGAGAAEELASSERRGRGDGGSWASRAALPRTERTRRSVSLGRATGKRVTAQVSTAALQESDPPGPGRLEGQLRTLGKCQRFVRLRNSMRNQEAHPVLHRTSSEVGAALVLAAQPAEEALKVYKFEALGEDRSCLRDHFKLSAESLAEANEREEAEARDAEQFDCMRISSQKDLFTSVTYTPRSGKSSDYPELLRLPAEIIVHICSYLGNPADLCSVTETCLALHILGSYDGLWRELCFRKGSPVHFMDPTPQKETNRPTGVPSLPWKTLYRDWCMSVSTEVVTDHGEYFLENLIKSREGTWRGCCYATITYAFGMEDLESVAQYASVLKRLRHAHVARVYSHTLSLGNSMPTMSLVYEHIGYDYLWGRSYFEHVAVHPPSERDIQSLVCQVVAGVEGILAAFSAGGQAAPAMVNPCWPSFIFLVDGMSTVKLTLFWHEIMQHPIPDYRKVLFAAPNVFLDDEDLQCESTVAWSLGILLYSMLCLRFPVDLQDTRNLVQLILAIVSSECDFSGKDWKHVSTEAKDLVKALLGKDARLRPTMKDVLQHPWLTNSVSTRPLPAYENVRASSIYRYWIHGDTSP